MMLTGVKCQLTDLCLKVSGNTVAKCSGFSRSFDRLDELYFDIVGQDREFDYLTWQC